MEEHLSQNYVEFRVDSQNQQHILMLHSKFNLTTQIETRPGILRAWRKVIEVCSVCATDGTAGKMHSTDELSFKLSDEDDGSCNWASDNMVDSSIPAWSESPLYTQRRMHKPVKPFALQCGCTNFQGAEWRNNSSNLWPHSLGNAILLALPPCLSAAPSVLFLVLLNINNYTRYQPPRFSICVTLLACVPSTRVQYIKMPICIV